MDIGRIVRSLVTEVGYFKEVVVIAIIIGIASGLVALVFYNVLDIVMHIFLELPVNYQVPEPSNGWGLTTPPERAWLIPILTGIGGLISGLIVYNLAPETEGHGTDAAIAAFHRYAGKVRTRVPLVKLLASSITIGSGGSAGREGPMAQIGSGIASKLADLFKLDTYKRRVAVATGIGAGIGTIFKAPLGGAIFGIEVLYKRDFEVEALIPAFIASTIGYAIFGYFTGYSHVFEIPPVSFSNPIEVIFYIILGIICSLFGLMYVKVFNYTHEGFRKLKVRRWVRTAIGGLLTGLIGFFFPQIIETGYGWITIFAHGIYPLYPTYEGWFISESWQLIVILLLLLAILKILATSFTICSGGSGGVFAPGLFIGALLGSSLGITFLNLFPDVISDPDTFLASTVVIGMASLFAGVSKAPVAVLIMVSEMTGGYEIIAPAMLSISISYLLTGKYTIYSEQVVDRSHSPAHIREYQIIVLEGIKVREAMKSVCQAINSDASVKKALSLMTKGKLREIPVIENGKLIGRVTFERLMQVPSDKRDITSVKDVLDKRIIVTYPDVSLLDVVKIMIKHRIDRLPVVENSENMKFIGMISRDDIIEAHDRVVRFILWEESEEVS